MSHHDDWDDRDRRRHEEEELIKAAERSKLDLFRPTGNDRPYNNPLDCYDDEFFPQHCLY